MTQRMGSHLTYTERCHIFFYKESGKSHREISRLLGFSHTTINNELKRNSIRYRYCSERAHQLSCKRRKRASSLFKKLNEDIVSKIKFLLISTQSSPVQISGRLKKEYGISISPETIYRYIWADKKAGGELYKNLRRRAKKYNKRANKLAGRGMIPGRIDISKRPATVDEKRRIGDFEVDTIVGSEKTGVIVSVVDKASKYVFLGLAPKATAENVSSIICKSLSVLKKNNLIHTMTSDNGKEFASHKKISKQLKCQFYFARPYHSWERGLNEHTNGLVRQYFPKGTKFSTLTNKLVKRVEHILNNRPRKILNFETPHEVFSRATGLRLSGNFQS